MRRYWLFSLSQRVYYQDRMCWFDDSIETVTYDSPYMQKLNLGQKLEAFHIIRYHIFHSQEKSTKLVRANKFLYLSSSLLRKIGYQTKEFVTHHCSLYSMKLRFAFSISITDFYFNTQYVLNSFSILLAYDCIDRVDKQ